jgi:hypothetical protein
MRAKLDIANGVLQAARARARREKRTTGEVISELARRALTAPAETPPAQAPKEIYGLRPFPKRGGIVTNELIDKLRDGDVA